MSNRIETCLADLLAKGRKGFIPYICAGDPSLGSTVTLVSALEQAGADIIELGLPFSDPVADGVVNQLAAQRALSAGTTTRGVLECVRQVRAQSPIPIVLYTYLNPVLQFGWEQFHDEAQSAGVDGLLILDLPPEEDTSTNRRTSSAFTDTELVRLDRLKRSSLTSAEDVSRSRAGRGEGERAKDGWPLHIRLIAPTTPAQRVKTIAQNARGFIYYVSREGVTGARDSVAGSLEKQLGILRGLTDLPVAVGFGISNPDQAREVARHADAVVVGSAIVDLIAKGGADSVEAVAGFASSIASAIN